MSIRLVIILGLFFLKCTLSVIAQTIKGYIYKKGTKEGIPFALITDIHKTTGSCSDSTGFFLFKNQSTSYKNRLYVSAKGYNSTEFQNDTLQIIIVELENAPNASVLTETNWKSGKKTVKLGAKANQIYPAFGCHVGANTEIALLMENPFRRLGKIKSVNFFIHEIGKFNAPFRIRVYQNDNGVPGDEITRSNIIVKGYKKKDWNNFDLFDKDMFMPIEGCFVAMEWLNLNDALYEYTTPYQHQKGLGQCLNLTNEFTKKTNFLRKNDGEWRESAYLEWNGFSLKYFNPSINIEVIF